MSEHRARQYTVSQKRIPTLSIVARRKITRFFNYNFWYKYSWHNWPSNDRSSSHLTQQNRTSEICLEMSKRTSVNIISPDMWPLTALLCSITMFAVSCNRESTRRRLGSDWLKSGTGQKTSTLLSTNGESICTPAFAQKADILNI